MTVTVDWNNDEQTTICYTFSGKWTWNEFYAALNQALVMETSVSHRVDVIIDMLGSKGIPSTALTHMRSIADKQPDNLGLSVFVTTDMLVTTLVSVGTRIHPTVAKSYRVAATVADAEAIIAEANAERAVDGNL